MAGYYLYEAEMVELAQHGRMDELIDLISRTTVEDEQLRFSECFRWASVTADLGNDDGLARIIEAELNDARLYAYDEGALARAEIHWDIGLAFLTGTRGLPTRHYTAARHVKFVRQVWTTDNGDLFPQRIQEARSGFDPVTRATFDTFWRGPSVGG